MKNLFKALSFAALVAFSASCTKDLCKDVDAGAHGTCLEGVVTCDTGYEPDSAGACNTEIRTKFLGSFTVSDVCTSSGTASYVVPVTSSTGSMLEVKLTNFWGTFTNQVTATVSGTTITIARQEPDADGYFVQGTGTISGSTITWSYTITDETDPANIISDACSSTWVK